MRYYIIAGEASGDLHGSNLMRGLYAEDPEATIRFWGGDAMSGVWEENERSGDGGLVRHYRGTAVMGLTDVLKKLGSIGKNLKSCREDILAWKPDVVILIDYPGFNLKMAEFAHSQGIKVFYYIAPKVWASRENRIRKIRRTVDRLFIIFPFEIPYFQSKGVDFIYKGNPLVDAIDRSLADGPSREEFLAANGLSGPYIALLAGSRKGEIDSMMPKYMEFARRLHSMERYRGTRFVVAGAPGRDMEDYVRWTKGAEDYVHVIFGRTHEVLRHAEAAVINSGTASLEAVLTRTPQVVAYAMSPISYAIAKRIIKTRYISLGNLVVDKLAFKELVQDEFTPEALMTEVLELLENESYRNRMLENYSEIRSRLGGGGASRAVASAMLALLR